MRILWLSNPPWSGSGYGEQTALNVPRIKALGHELAIAANYGLQAAAFPWFDFSVYPADGQWGNQSVSTFAEHYGADLILALCDAWVLHPEAWPKGPPLAVWAPVDHYPLPPKVKEVLAHERVTPIAMSRFGEREMRKAGLEPSYVPHSVDTEMFKPQPEKRASVREDIGLPADAFVVGMVAANKGNPSMHRKSFPQAFDAFARFAKTHEDAYLYVHSQATPGQGGGISLDALAEKVGMPQDRLRFTPEKFWQLGMRTEAVAALYQAFSCLLMPSMGEGFGIPALEAQASGVPVIVSDHSAMTELCGSGWLVEGDRWWDALQDSFLIAPSIDCIEERLESAYASAGTDAMRNRARKFALEYDADKVAEEFWRPTLARLAAPAAKPAVVTNCGPNRAQRRALAKVAV